MIPNSNDNLLEFGMTGIFKIMLIMLNYLSQFIENQ